MDRPNTQVKKQRPGCTISSNGDHFGNTGKDLRTKGEYVYCRSYSRYWKGSRSRKIERCFPLRSAGAPGDLAASPIHPFGRGNNFLHHQAEAVQVPDDGGQGDSTLTLVEYTEGRGDLPVASRANRLDKCEGFAEDLYIREEYTRSIEEVFLVIGLAALTYRRRLPDRLAVKGLICMLRYEKFFFVCHDYNIFPVPSFGKNAPREVSPQYMLPSGLEP